MHKENENLESTEETWRGIADKDAEQEHRQKEEERKARPSASEKAWKRKS